jgi:hypothetical protein
MESQRHAELIAELEAAASTEWGPRALLACLKRLRDGGPAEAHRVFVHEAWARDDAFQVVYDSPEGLHVGLIRERGTTIDRLDPADAEISPEEFGQEVADFNIGEPLGAYAEILDVDSQGLGWWGHLPLPTRSRRRGRRVTRSQVKTGVLLDGDCPQDAHTP